MGNALGKIIENNKSFINKFDKFAIICLDDKAQICNENFSTTSDNKSKKEAKSSQNFENEVKATLQTFKERFVSIENRLNTLDIINQTLVELKNSVRTLQNNAQFNVPKTENTQTNP